MRESEGLKGEEDAKQGRLVDNDAATRKTKARIDK